MMQSISFRNRRWQTGELERDGDPLLAAPKAAASADVSCGNGSGAFLTWLNAPLNKLAPRAWPRRHRGKDAARRLGRPGGSARELPICVNSAGQHTVTACSTSRSRVDEQLAIDTLKLWGVGLPESIREGQKRVHPCLRYKTSAI